MSNLLQGVLLPSARPYHWEPHPVLYRIVIAAAAVAFIIVHTPMQLAYVWYDSALHYLATAGYVSHSSAENIISQKPVIMQQYIVPLRTMLFFISFLIIGYPFVRSIVKYGGNNWQMLQIKDTTAKAFRAFLFLSVLVFPLQLGIMAEGYAQMSFDPFGVIDNSFQIYQRILMPAIASFVQLQGPVLYHLFSLGITVVLLMMIVTFFRVRGIELSVFELVSIGTSSFIITQFQSPGYTESLAYLLLLSLFIIPMPSVTRISVVVCALLTHEISVAVIAVVALLYFNREEKWMTGSLLLMYAGFWLLSFGFDISGLLRVREVGEMGALAWLAQHPLREISGIVISYKLMWILIVWALFQLKAERTAIIGIIGASILLTFGGVDTSRLMGYMFMALLLSYFWIRKNSLLPERTLKAILVANIVIPSFYIGTNVGIASFNGVYQLFYYGMLLK